MAKRHGRQLVAEALDLVCGHCGKIVLSKADYAAIQEQGGIPLNLDHPGLVKILRRRAGDDFAECPHCHSWHALVMKVDLNGGPALWTITGLRLIEGPPEKRYWEGQVVGGH